MPFWKPKLKIVSKSETAASVCKTDVSESQTPFWGSKWLLCLDPSWLFLSPKRLFQSDCVWIQKSLVGFQSNSIHVPKVALRCRGVSNRKQQTPFLTDKYDNVWYVWYPKLCFAPDLSCRSCAVIQQTETTEAASRPLTHKEISATATESNNFH